MQKFRRTGVARGLSYLLALAMFLTGMTVPKVTVLAEETTEVIYKMDLSASNNDGWTSSGISFATESGEAGLSVPYVNAWISDDHHDTPVTFSRTVENVVEGTYAVSIKAIKGNKEASVPDDVKISVSGNGASLTEKAVDLGAWGDVKETVTDQFTTDQTMDLTITVTAKLGYMAFGDVTLTKYTTLEEAPVDKETLQALVDSVPENYENMNFTDITALKKALQTAEECLAGENASEEEIETAYAALLEAISSLVISDKDIFVEKIDSISDNTIRGMDVSSYLSIMDSFDELNQDRAEGEKLGFKDFDGNLLDKQEFFDFLAGQGVNYIRLRVWNNPYDANKNGFGGGNNDLDKAIEMGKYATNADMHVLIDFHLSDFWADPGKQKSPRQWAGQTIGSKCTYVENFVRDSLNSLLEAGVDVTMVQIGNETNGQICGENDWSLMNRIFDAGCDAVHEVAEAKDKGILAAVHFTNPEKAGLQEGYAKNLADYDGDKDGTKEGVSYDVFATSYYPYWHGSLTNLNAVLTKIAETYDKYVMVAETSYANTLKDTDGHENTVRVGNNDKVTDCPWMFTNQGQVNEFRDVLNTVTDVDVTLENGDKAGLGVFYWEGAWIAVQNVYDENGEVDEALLQQNKEMWEKHGSGWASSYAAVYDPDDAGKWFGGSAVDNQAFFGVDGKALPSIKVYNPDYLKYGTTTEKRVDGYTSQDVTIEVGDTVTTDKLGGVTVTYNDETSDDVSVTWNADDISKVNAKAKNNQGIGSYIINGVLEEDESFAVQVKVTVVPKNILADYGFEEGGSAWKFTGDPDGSGSFTDNVEKKTACVTDEDPRTGKKGFHFYCKSAFTADAEQEVTVTEPGIYAAHAYVQGSGAEAWLTVSVNSISVSGNNVDSYESGKATLDGWQNWKQPTVNDIVVTQKMLDAGDVTLRLGLHTDGAADAWGTWDDAYLYLAESAVRYPNKINVSPAVINLTEGSTAKLVVTFEPEDTNITDVIFTSSNEAAAVVSDDGTVTGKKEGKATIRVTSAYDEDVYAQVQVTVTKRTQDKPQTPVETPKPVGTTAKTATASYKVTKAAQGAAEVEFTAPLSKTVKSVTIPDTITIDGISYKVTSVANNAFKSNKKLTTVKLGNNITTIGKNAFSGCTKLKTVKLNTALQVIDNSAFSGCTALKSLTVPKNVTSIGSKAFNGCKNLKKITIKSTALKKVGSKALKGISAKATIKVPKKQLKTYQKLLKGKGQAKTVKIKK